MAKLWKLFFLRKFPTDYFTVCPNFISFNSLLTNPLNSAILLSFNVIVAMLSRFAASGKKGYADLFY